MIIIWSGSGLLVPVIAVAAMVVAEVLIPAVTQDPHFFQSHGWARSAGLWVAAAVLWPFVRAMNRAHERVMLDPRTGEQVIVRSGRGGHSLFFIPIEYWAMVCISFAVFMLFVK